VVLLLRRPSGDRPAPAANPTGSGGRAMNPVQLAGLAVIGVGVVAAIVALMPSRSRAPAPVTTTQSADAPASTVQTPAPAAPEQQPAIAEVPPPAATGAGAVVPGAYSCSAFMGVPPNGHLQPMPGFTVGSDGSYVHQDGVAGTLTVSGNVVEFHGGALDGQAATFDAGPAGRGTIHIYNESRSRTVIDCEGA
jgi:hypothetical protein